MVFQLKQFLKMGLQNVVLPVVYGFWRLVYGRKKPELIVFADAHHSSIPFSMNRIHEELIRRGFAPVDVFRDYEALGQVRAAWEAVRFMRLYARAGYVFICDNFLPVASCRKNHHTRVIQLWHSCGLLKKMGYDTGEDIPSGYRGNVYRNYDLVTVSAPCCIEPLRTSMHQMPGVVRATGVSRTDTYYDGQWRERCREAFYRLYPDAREKRVVLWAPTFRGNAAHPYLAGAEQIDDLERRLGDSCLVIRKVHPHLQKQYGSSDCPIPTEELFPVTDVMITDYSSAVFDFLLFDKPVVLFAPDFQDYQRTRGFYSSYETLSPYVVTEADQLKDNVISALEDREPSWIAGRRQYHMSACDGHATERILDLVGLKTRN